MSDAESNDAKILRSWSRNAAPWVTAVREHQIESRRLITDGAIVDAVLALSPTTALDIRCGEGWLARALDAHDVKVIGVDATPTLIEEATGAGGGDFRLLLYEEIAAGILDVSVDAIVCNFSLFGRESVESLIKALSTLLNPRGALVVQTLHPHAFCGEAPYRDGWRSGSWDGFGSEFADPAPWYFRTLESWMRLFRHNGFRDIDIYEPIHPRKRQPASIIFVARPALPSADAPRRSPSLA
jgi:2-polyprenyl-3-methyl-5-hydroxy-6-metoxy-1,4-benzoquinol methylase